MYVAIRNRTRVIGLMSVHSYRMKAFDEVSSAHLGDAGRLLRRRAGADTGAGGIAGLAGATAGTGRAFAVRARGGTQGDDGVRRDSDELGQALTGFKMDLVWIRNRMQGEDAVTGRQPILEKMAKMGTLLDATANLMRRLCTELRPGVLDDLGLVAAIIEWQERAKTKAGPGIKCETRLGSEGTWKLTRNDPPRCSGFSRRY